MPLANSIDEVITRLTAIIDQSRNEKSRAGYFAALYRKVTIRVNEGIAQGRFENGARMKSLDVNFANRYLEAYDQHCSNQPTTASWAVAFDATAQWRPLILQHLLLGMNAHINLDLGIAAQMTCPGSMLPALQTDFETINTILAELVSPVESEIASVSPWMRLLNKISPRTDDVIINFSMNVARQSAWQFALKLNSCDASQLPSLIQQRDAEVAQLASKVSQPNGLLPNMGLFAIRIRESNNVPQVIQVLS